MIQKLPYFKLSKAVGLAGVLTLSGCMVGPDYQAPITEAPTQWDAVALAGQPHVAQPSVATTGSPQIAEWWKSFNDPTMTSLVERATASNLDMKLAEQRLRESRASRGVVSAGLWPDLNFNGSYQRSRVSDGHGGGVQSDLFKVGLDAAWELDFFGGVRRDIEAAEADIQASIEDLHDVQVSVAAEVALDYLSLRGYQQQLAIAKSNLQSQEQTAEVVRKQVKAGFASALDQANAEAQVATTRAQLPLYESSIRQTVYAISVLLGQQPAALNAELLAEAPLPAAPPEIPVGLPSELLRRRPDIRKAEAQVHAATARIGVATADLFPKISLTGSLGLQSDQLKSLTTASQHFWAFGPTVSWPIFDAGRIGANIEVADAQTKQALLSYQQTVLTGFQDVESALVAYAKEQEHREALAAAVAANQKAVELATTLYRNGQTDFLNVLTAQRALLETQNALVQSNMTVDTNLVALYKALGGGWPDETAHEAK